MGITDFKTNPKAAAEGVWVDFSANKDGSVPGFKMARMSRVNRNYLKAIETETKPVARSIELGTIQPEAAEKVSLDIFIKSVLLDWRNIQPNDDGVNVDFNEANATKLLAAPEWEDLYSELVAKAKSATTYRDEALTVAAKN